MRELDVAIDEDELILIKKLINNIIYFLMPKKTVALLIYEGYFDWVIRLSTHELKKDNYRVWYLSKKEYNLDQAKIFRNERMRELEECKLRNQKRRGYTSLNIGMN